MAISETKEREEGKSSRQNLAGYVYIACQTRRSDDYLQWNNDLFALKTEESLLLKAQGFSILALGDFNTRIGRVKGMKENLPDVNNTLFFFIRM